MSQSYSYLSRCVLVIALFALFTPTASLHAEERTVTALYNDALARERDLRASGATAALNDMRDTIAAYEAIVLHFPTSQYGDHALWQAAGLTLEAFDLHRETTDFNTGMRLLDTLTRRHAASPFAARVDERRRQFEGLRPAVWLTQIEREVHDGVVRITVHLDGEVRFHSGELEAPSRLFFDLSGTDTTPLLRNATLTFGDDHDIVREIRLGSHPNQITRLVLDTENVEACDTFSLYDPFRLVIDCRSSIAPRPPAIAAVVTSSILAASPELPPANPIVADSTNIGDANATPLSRTKPRLQTRVRGRRPSYRRRIRDGVSKKAPPVLLESPRREAAQAKRSVLRPAAPMARPVAIPQPDETPGAARPNNSLSALNPTGTFSLARQLGLGVSRIVIDPGHGGYDPGARAGALIEAELVLDIAKRLEQRLKAHPNLEVVLTRRTDEYVPLEARTSLAKRVGADLFLSIHANASQKPNARGIETYFLNFTADPEVEARAARENLASAGRMGKLDELVEAITTNNKLEESREFAGIIQKAMLQKLRGVDPEVPDLGVKQAPFRVLIGANIPSVLSEISFVTNQQDATLLSTTTYRDLIADALLEGILQYQLSLESTPRVAWKGQATGDS